MKHGVEVIKGTEVSQHTHRQANPLHRDLRTSSNGLGLLLSRALLIHFSTSTAREDSNACTQAITTPKKHWQTKRFASGYTTPYTGTNKIERLHPGGTESWCGIQDPLWDLL